MRLLNLTRRHDNAFGTLPIFVAKFNGSFRKLKSPIEKVTASCRHDSRRVIDYMNVAFHLDDCQLIFAGSEGQQLIILGETFFTYYRIMLMIRSLTSHAYGQLSDKHAGHVKSVTACPAGRPRIPI